MEMTFESPKSFIGEDLCFIDIVFDKRGIDCKFIKVTPNVGIKVYRHRETAEATYAMQNKFYDLDLAPKCWGYDFDEDNGLYYYFTEIVDIANDILENIPSKYTDVIREFYHLLIECRSYIEEYILPSHGYDYAHDMHFNNFGFKDGQILIIDFSEFCH